MAELPSEIVKLMKADSHQICSDFSLPCNPELFENVLSREKFVAIFHNVGRGELERMASVKHRHQEAQSVNRDALVQREKADLDVLRSAITEVTGEKNPWIIGFAADFAQGLLKYVDKARSDSD